MRLVALLVLVLLSGCAASVKQGHSTGDLEIPEGSRSNLVASFEGTPWVSSNPQWGRFKSEWASALTRAAANQGLTIFERTHTAGHGGLIIKIEVSNFRYVTSGMRYGFGVMTGNAWVECRVSFVDGQTGDILGARALNTSSSAWEGVFSAMTDEQLEALSQQIVSEVVAAKVRPRSAPTLPASRQSKEERLMDLMNQKMTYDEYMRRRKEILAEPVGTDNGPL